MGDSTDLLDQIDTDEIPENFREDLSLKQQKCLLLELSGTKRKEIANYLDVDRSTIWRWDNKVEAYEEAKKALWDSYVFPELQRVLNNTDEIADTLVDAVKNRDPDIAMKLFDRVFQEGGLRDIVIKDRGSQIVAQDPQEENLLRVFRRNKANERMLKYVSMLIEEKDPDQVIELIHNEISEVEEAPVDADYEEEEEE